MPTAAHQFPLTLVVLSTIAWSASAFAPGEVRFDTFHILGPTAWDGVTHRPLGAVLGRMRLVYSVQSCRGDGQCPLSAPAGRSNAFDVQLAPS